MTYRNKIKIFALTGLAMSIFGLGAASLGAIKPNHLALLGLVDTIAWLALYQEDRLREKIKRNTEKAIADNLDKNWLAHKERNKAYSLWSQLQSAITIYDTYEKSISTYQDKQKREYPDVAQVYLYLNAGNQARLNDIQEMLNKATCEDRNELEFTLNRHSLNQNKTAFNFSSELIKLLNDYGIKPHSPPVFANVSMPPPLSMPSLPSEVSQVSQENKFKKRLA